MLTRKILLALLIAGAAMMPTLTPATAQPPESPGGGPGRMMGPGAMMGPGMMGRGGFGALCGPRAAGFAEWRMERIERAVRPTEAQRAALNELRAASAKAAETIAAACPSEIPLTSSGRLEFMEKRLEAMLQAVKIVRPAFDAFRASLTDEQKARLDEGGPRRWGWERWRRGDW